MTTETKSYMDVSGQILIDGKPLQFMKRQQNLSAKPSRHRKQDVNEDLLKLSVKDAAISMAVVMLFFTVMCWIISVII